MSKDKIVIGLISIVLILVVIGIYVINVANGTDDWVYKSKKHSYDKQWGSVNSYEDSKVGYSTGGAKDINNYRDNIKRGYFPLHSDITYEGLFYDYYFDTKTNSINGDKKDLFSPSISTAISKDPISNNDEYYLTVGLNSNLNKKDIKRKKLNIVIVLDISGSMSSSIDDYYYDHKGKSDYKSKMKLAEESVNILIDQLNKDDSLGIVLFDDDAYLAKPLSKVSVTNVKAIKKHMLEVEPQGGTNFEAGYREAMDVFEKYNALGSKADCENRIIVITDAMPNIGKTSYSELSNMMRNAQNSNINTTFIGVGVDFNSDVVKHITDVKGANYYKVSSEEEFKTRMGKEFDYMVTPMIYDLDMRLSSNSFRVEKVYGTDSINSEKSNGIMHVNTLFPSESNNNGEVKGGVILVKVKKIGNDNNLDIKLNWKTADGKADSSSLNVNFKNNTYYDNTGIRKAIVLSRYVNTVKDWVSYDRDTEKKYLINENTGIIDNPYNPDYERRSIPLKVGPEYRNTFIKLKDYMNKEIKEIEDSTMNQEIIMIDQILNSK